MRCSQIISQAKRLYCRNTKKGLLCDKISCTYTNHSQAYVGQYLCQGCGVGKFFVPPGRQLQATAIRFPPQPTFKEKRNYHARRLEQQKRERELEIRAAATQAASVAASRFPLVHPLNVKKSSKSNAQRLKRTSKQITSAQVKEIRARAKAEKRAELERSKMKELPQTPLQRFEIATTVVMWEEQQKEREKSEAKARRVKSYH